MKRGTIEHPKMLMLEAQLGIARYEVVGIMESLWHWASRYAIQGDIGKWSNVAIAKGIGWSKDPDSLIDALISSGWVDQIDGTERLVIHDVKDHADNTWKQNLEDAGLKWWDGSRPRNKGQGSRPDRKNMKNNKKSTSRKPQENLQGTSKVLPQPEPISSIQSLYPIPPTPRGDVDCIFEFWKIELGHPKAKLDKTRAKCITNRLKEKYSVDRIKAAICGIKRSPHHMGKNEQGMVYDDIEFICRNGKNIDRFADIWEATQSKQRTKERINRPPILDQPPLTDKERAENAAAAKRAREHFEARLREEKPNEENNDGV